MNVAVIIARGGSKRIPRKNIRNFAGKPIIAYSIEVAMNSKMFERIIVSTDSLEVAEISRTYGAEIPFRRPAELANDHAGTDEVFIYALQWLHENDRSYDFACCIYPTAPLLKAQYLKEGLKCLKQSKATTSISVAAYRSPIFRSLKVNERGRLIMNWEKYYDCRSQDLPEAYHDAGQFYWVDVKKYLQEKRVWSQDSVPVVIPFNYVMDIDTEDDWKAAEIMFESIKGNKRHGKL